MPPSAAAQLIAELKELLSSNLCPDEIHFRLGRLIGTALGTLTVAGALKRQIEKLQDQLTKKPTKEKKEINRRWRESRPTRRGNALPFREIFK